MTIGDLLIRLSDLPSDMTIDLAINCKTVGGVAWIYGTLNQVNVYGEDKPSLYFQSDLKKEN